MNGLSKSLSLLISLIFFIYLASLDFTVFDMSHHLFFTKHYKNSWFSLIDQHVGGGLDLRTYPPLAYQIMAPLSFIFPLEISYYILLLLSWLSLSYSSSKFFTSYLKIKDSKFWLTFLFVFFSTGIMVTIFVFGQLTTIVGLSFGFASLYWFNRFLEENQKSQKKNLISKNIIISIFSLSLTALSHNFSFFLISIIYIFIMLFELKILLGKPRGFLMFLICSSILILPIYYPSFTKSLTNSLIPRREVIHWSRSPFITYLNFERWFSIYGLSIFMLGFPIILFLSKAKNRGRCLKLYTIALFFFLIGLGRATPLTGIFGGLEYWLTYERFSLVSSIIFIALFSLFIPDIPKAEIPHNGHKVNLLHVVFLMAFLIINGGWLGHSHELFFAHPIGHQMNRRSEITEYVLDFLNQAQPNYRYQTLGYGRPIGEIYLYSGLPTLDTDYFTGRTVDWIRDSGIDEIDQTKDSDFLNKFMDNANNHSVKYIITFSDFYHQFMKMHNWILIENKNFDGVTVMIWDNPSEITEFSPPPEDKTLLNYVWGIEPPLVLFVFLFLLTKYNLKANEKVPE